MRESGILFPIFSIPSKFGIGSFSEEAFKFVDFLEGAGQGFWQILPIGPTGYGNSPYQPFSAFAGNPYFISPEVLIKDSLLTWDECNAPNFGNDETKVDYGAIYENRDDLLEKAYERFSKEGKEQAEYKAFLKRDTGLRIMPFSHPSRGNSSVSRGMNGKKILKEENPRH